MKAKIGQNVQVVTFHPQTANPDTIAGIATGTIDAVSAEEAKKRRVAASPELTAIAVFGYHGQQGRVVVPHKTEAEEGADYWQAVPASK